MGIHIEKYKCINVYIHVKNYGLTYCPSGAWGEMGH